MSRLIGSLLANLADDSGQCLHGLLNFFLTLGELLHAGDQLMTVAQNLLVEQLHLAARWGGVEHDARLREERVEGAIELSVDGAGQRLQRMHIAQMCDALGISSLGFAQ